ncbi:DUF2690 domain-containing protein [Streptomyces sp. NPDC051738]|uniref:helix-turn-helix domain-containing protein n=1 Tax=Streptomyces sp. NPDC051738 TaxID=3365672 RepID=UPI0037D10408
MTKPSPSTSPERARLAATLRELKVRTSLSLVGLATKTTYSKSSWDRYLNGRALPPRDAVQKLCRLAGEPEGRCLALWEIAEAEGSGRGAGSGRSQCAGSPPLPSREEVTPADDGAGSGGGAGGGDGCTADAGAVRRSATAMAVLATVCAVVVGGLATAVLLLPHRDGEPRSALSPSSSPAAPGGPRCRGAVCEGRSPMQMKCGAEPTTVAAHRTATGTWMELRYSEECGTSWARMWRTRIGDRIEMTAGGGEDPDGREDRDGRDGRDGREATDGPEDRAGPVRSAEVQDAVDADSYLFTPMTVAHPGTVVRACFRPAAGGEGECFDARVPG